MREKLKITILVDDHACKGMSAEHGLSLWIEAGTRRILFDTGQVAALPENAEILGIDLKGTDILVLSHGHYDHSGCISNVVNEARSLELYCHPDAVQHKYAKREKIIKPIGMPDKSKDAINGLASRNLHWVSLKEEISEEIGITGFIPRKTGYEDIGGQFYLDPEARRADPVNDDMAFWIRTDRGLVICVGCCHAGLINTLNYVRQLNTESRIWAIIGGFHLVGASEQRLSLTIDALRSMKPEIVIPCHCTGKTAVTAFRDVLGERVLPGFAGMTLEF